MGGKLHLVYATDSGYLVPTAVSASSAVYWAGRPEDLILDILDCGFSDQDWNELRYRILRCGKNVKLYRHIIDMSQFEGLKTWHGSKGIYARLLIPLMLSDTDWCVYCDSDTLFLSDPFELFLYMDSSYALVGQLDLPIDENKRKWFEGKGFEWDAEQYVCAGFIIENLKWLRENGGVSWMIDFVREKRPPFNDQDALNIFCFGKIKALTNAWGALVYNLNYSMEPRCIHYAAAQPWKVSRIIRSGFGDATRIWYVYAKKLCGFKRADFGRDYYFLTYCVNYVIGILLRSFCRIWLTFKIHNRFTALFLTKFYTDEIWKKCVPYIENGAPTR